MDPGDLARALLAGDTLSARQWVKDAHRARLDYASLASPSGLDATGYSLAAALVELLAARAGQRSPPWAAGAGPAPSPVWLVPSAARHPALRARCEEHGPEPLRRRRFFAMPDFLAVPPG